MTRAEERALEQFPETSPVRSADITDDDRLRWAFIRGYQQAEIDVHEDMFNDEKVMPREKAVEYAFELFGQYVDILVQSLSTIAKNYRGMSCTANTMPMQAYAKAKAEAFEEFVERIKKEYDILMQPIRYGDKYEIYNAIKKKKNFDLDGIIPENKYRGTKTFDKLLRFKGKIADLLELYAYKAFEHGALFYKLQNESKLSGFKAKEQVLEEMSNELHLPGDYVVDEDVVDDGYGHGIGC